MPSTVWSVQEIGPGFDPETPRYYDIKRIAFDGTVLDSFLYECPTLDPYEYVGYWSLMDYVVSRDVFVAVMRSGSYGFYGYGVYNKLLIRSNSTTTVLDIPELTLFTFVGDTQWIEYFNLNVLSDGRIVCSGRIRDFNGETLIADYYFLLISEDGLSWEQKIIDPSNNVVLSFWKADYDAANSLYYFWGLGGSEVNTSWVYTTTDFDTFTELELSPPPDPFPEGSALFLSGQLLIGSSFYAARLIDWDYETPADGLYVHVYSNGVLTATYPIVGTDPEPRPNNYLYPVYGYEYGTSDLVLLVPEYLGVDEWEMPIYGTGVYQLVGSEFVRIRDYGDEEYRFDVLTRYKYCDSSGCAYFDQESEIIGEQEFVTIVAYYGSTRLEVGTYENGPDYPIQAKLDFQPGPGAFWAERVRCVEYA